VILSWVLGKPVVVRPLPVSKVNTVAQIVLASLALASLAFDWSIAGILLAAIVVVAITTLLSVGFYLTEWVRHMGGNGAPTKFVRK
jgi:cardiolipin synthase